MHLLDSLEAVNAVSAPRRPEIEQDHSTLPFAGPERRAVRSFHDQRRHRRAELRLFQGSFDHGRRGSIGPQAVGIHEKPSAAELEHFPAKQKFPLTRDLAVAIEIDSSGAPAPEITPVEYTIRVHVPNSHQRAA